ncbi:MAG: ABC transporter ATP-binding protein [Deferrisomatales bacterium]
MLTVGGPLLGPFARHLRGRGRQLAVLFLLGLAASAASLATPLLGKAFVDAVATRRDYGAVPAIAAALVGLALLDLGLGLLTRWWHTRLSAGVLVEIRRRLFRSCLDAPLDHVEGFRHGDLMSRFGSDVPRVQGLLVDGVLGGVQNLLFLAVAAAILLRLSAPLAGWSFLGLLAALAVTAGFRRPVEARARAIQEALADLSHFLAERLGAMRPVRFHRTQAEEERRFRRLNEGLVGKVLAFQLLDGAAGGLPGLALSLSLAWIYLLGGRLLETGEIGLGTFVAFVLYQGRLYGPARGLLGLVRQLQEGRVSFERVVQVLGPEEPPREPQRAGEELAPGEIRFEGVAFAYPGRPPLFEGLDLRVRPGEKVAIFGPSGAGKSTLVQLLFGLRRPGSGRVRVGAAPGEMGYAGAEPFLLHATVEENLTYGNPGVGGQEILWAARLAEAHGFILTLPQGYRTVIGGRGLSLSDGQRQRIGLARLVLRRPRIAVLDEALSALDLGTEGRVRRNLWEAWGDRTVVGITHRVGGLDAFDRLLLLQDGQLREVAPGALSRWAAQVEGPSLAERPLRFGETVLPLGRSRVGKQDITTKGG